MVTSAQRRFLGQGAKLGKYEVIRQIAVGRMAELYLARTVGMEGFEKLVCVKRILPQFSDNPSFVNLFANEAQLAATLRHPNIAQVYDIGQEQAEFFFAMEYIHGEDLGRLVTAARDSGVAVSLDCALTVASGLCAGLHHAHEKASPEGRPLGVVHRDVSPSNVLVSYDGAVKLVDFGIARASGEPMASITGLKGKIAYMSPEQCRGKVALDRRSDVFSIGTILYELTTGRLPFADATEYGVLQQIVNRDAEPPSRLVGGYPPALEAIVMRALSRDVERRFSTALELQNQLEDFAHDNRLRVSPLVLARLMSTLFPARLEEWDHARAQGAFFVEQHVVRTLIESGKTPDGGSRFVPQSPAEPFDEAAMREDGPTVPAARWAAAHGEAPADGGAGASMSELPTVPAVRGSAPRAPGQPSTQPATMGHPRLPTPPPLDGRGTAPGQVSTALSQPRLSPPGGPPGGRYAQMPVPNMPGAVPIVAPLMAHPVASAGTLVSSALQAGTSAAAAAMPSMPLGTLPGAGGAPGSMGPAGGAGMMPGAPGMPGAMGTMPGAGMPGAAPSGSIGGPPGGYVPAASGDFGRDAPSHGNAPGYGFPPLRSPTGPGDASRSSGPQAAIPNSASAGARSRASAQRTMVMRAAGRARWPIVAGLGVAVAGTIAVVVAIGLGGDAAPSPGGPGVTAPSPADPGNAEAAKGVAGSGAMAADPAKPGDPAATESAARGDGEAAKAAAQVVAAPAGAVGTGGTAAAAGADPGPTGPSANGAGTSGTGTAGTALAATGANGAGANGAGANGAGANGAGANGAGANGAGANGAGAARTVAGEPGANSAGANGAGGVGTRAGAAAPGAKGADTGAAGFAAVPSDDGSKKPRKPARPRGRADAKRSEPKRGSKAEPKEPSWNDDSPFLPVQTPKR